MDFSKTIAEIGEKKIINDLLRPLFNPDGEQNSVGDDCAAVQLPSGSLALMSTDRVPADLISFRTNVIDYYHLGRYLGVLNLSDIAACGGIPLVLLFNCGLPSRMSLQQLLNISLGLRDIAEKFDAKIVGGDVTSSSELSLSAAILGHVEKGMMLRRSGALVGDSVFVSREIGLTPVALDYCLNRRDYGWLTTDERFQLEGQFLSLEPEIHLGRRLCLSGQCTSCMDNTDGIAQSLSELARESNCSIIIESDALRLSTLVERAAIERNLAPLTLALGAGADFALVGTLAGNWTTVKARQAFGAGMHVIGRVQTGTGIFLATGSETAPLTVRGWNYFLPEE